MIMLNDELKIEKSSFKGKNYISIRKWYDDNGVLKPGKNGINMTEEEWQIFVEKFEDIKQTIVI